MPAPPFPPPPAMTGGPGPLPAPLFPAPAAGPSFPPARAATPGTPDGALPSWAAAPVSAPPPPVVPAPALPTWPPPATPARDADTTRPVRPQPAGPDLGTTAYGGTDGPGFATVSFPQGNPLENSGSLTGHILAQGWSEESPAARAGNTKVIIVLAVAMTMLIAISLLVVFLANDALSGLTGTALIE